MEQKVIFKKYVKSDQLWEHSLHKAVGIYLLIFLLLFFGGMFFLRMLFLPDFIIHLYRLCLLVAWVAFVVWRNSRCSLTKSTVFIQREKTLYMVQVGYIGQAQTVGKPPQTAVLGWENSHNPVQENEKITREGHQGAALFVQGLDEYLTSGNLPEYIHQISAMPNPRIEKETKRNVWISYSNDGGRTTKKIRNVYDFSSIPKNRWGL